MAINFLNIGQFPDNAKLYFGASEDLQIYHNGTNSIIDNNTNDLIIRCDGDDIKILAEDDVVIRDNDDSTEMAKFINGGAVELYHNGSKKFETTTQGIHVSADITLSGKQVFSNNEELRWEDTGGTERTILELTNSNDLYVGGSYSGSLFFMGGGSYTEKMKIDDSGNVLVQDDFNVGYTNSNTLNAKVAIKKSENISADATSRGVYIDYNLSGTTVQTGDRFYDALLIDADSSATGGDATNEVRFSGIRSMVEDSGDANDLYGGYFDVRNDKTIANDIVNNVFGTYSAAYGRHTAGQVKNVVGGYFVGYTDNADSGSNVTTLAGIRAFALQTSDSGKTVDNAYGVYGKVDLAASSNNGTFTNADGVYGEVEIDDADCTINNARAVRGTIDSNGGTISSAYQFFGTTSTSGTITNSWGIYSTGASKNYLAGTLQLASYGSGSQTGTSAYYLIADSSGNIIEKTPTEVRSDIGAGTGSGTVTSVGITAGTGISVSGSPITGSGSITVTNTAPATIDGSGAATRLAYWSDTDTLTSDAGLTYDSGNHLTTTAQVRAGDGTKGAPAYSFDSDRDTGVYLEAAGDIGFTQGGNIQMRINSSGVGVYTDIFHVGDTDTKIAFTTNTITVTTGGTEAFDVTSGATRFSTSTRFTANATWDDNSKALFGDNSDIQIYSDNTTAYIEMPTLSNFIIGDSTAFTTGNIALVRVSELTGTKSIEEDWMGVYTSANTGLSYMTSSGTVRIETQNSGAKVTGDLTVTSDVLDRDIPCLFNSNFLDGTSSVIYVVPFNNNSEATVSAKTYYHYITMPYAGKLTKIIMKNVSGSPSSGFTTQLFLYVNGSQQASSSELTISSSKIEWTPTTSNTFAAGDELSFGYQKSASSKTWSGVSFGVAIELTDYDI
jgi:hypothetical protein